MNDDQIRDALNPDRATFEGGWTQEAWDRQRADELPADLVLPDVEPYRPA